MIEHLAPLEDEPETRRALEILHRDFSTVDAVGPRRVADFLVGATDDEIQADVAGFVNLLERHLKRRLASASSP